MTHGDRVPGSVGGAPATRAALGVLLAGWVAGCSELKVYRGGDAAGDVAEVTLADLGDAASEGVTVDAAGDATLTVDALDVEDAADAAEAEGAADVEDAADAADDAAEAGCDGAAVLCGGACVEVSASVAHCGRCDNACPARANAAATCAAGACGAACNAGFADCDGDADNGCEASLEGAAHCGRCGARCEEPTPLCGMRGGATACVDGCTAGEVRCGTSCVDTARSEEHCGRCGNACPMGATCAAGVCACPSGQTNCNGACRETGSDCAVGRGACLRTGAVICAAMGTETQCSARPGAAGAETCNGVDDDCDGAVDGAAAAMACPARANAAATCATGACGYACATGFGDCDGDAANGCEVELRASAANCSACGARCEAGQGCAGGVCLAQRTSCPALSEAGCGALVLRGGTFTFGQSDALGQLTPPVSGVSVSDFELDVAEVTVARFRRFWSAGHPGVPGDRVPYPEGTSLPWMGAVAEPTTSTVRAVCNWSPTPSTREDHPINCVDWYTAQAFCVWDGGRLPTEAEFEYAARTSMGFTYPWGEAPPDVRACWSGVTTRLGTCAAGAFPPTRDLYDLAGNVWERLADANDPSCWTSGFRTRNPLCVGDPTANRAIRGGAFDTTGGEVARLRGASRSSDPPMNPDSNAGMRCARSR